MKYEQFILPIFNRNVTSNPTNIFENGHVILTTNGNGFLIDNYFITAAHVVNDSEDSFVFINDKEFHLSKEKAVVWKLPNNIESDHSITADSPGDVAVFEIPGVKSDLILAQSLPNTGDNLINLFWHTKKYQTINRPYTDFIMQTMWKHIVVKHKDSLDNMSCYAWESFAKIYDKTGFCGKYFAATMNPIPPIGGSSGSPLIKDNVVYGVVHGGSPIDNNENTPINHSEINVFYAATDVFK